MSIRFPTEAANADVMGEDPAAPTAGGFAPAARTQPKQDHRVSRSERAAGDLRGERPRPGKPGQGAGFGRGRDDGKP